MHTVPRVSRGAGLVKALVGIEILVVDEEIETRELLEAVFAYCGALVMLAATVDEALAMIARKRADVVVASTALPGRDAVRLLRELRALRDGVEPIAVVAIVGRGGTDQKLCDGFDTFLRQPLDPWELCRVIAALARRA